MAGKNPPPKDNPKSPLPASGSLATPGVGCYSRKTDEPEVEPLSQDVTQFQTPLLTRVASYSPSEVLLPVETMEITPKGVRNNFIQLRELLNGYVQEKRNKGVRVRLSYDELEVTLSPMRPPLCGTTSLSVSRATTSPNPIPYLMSDCSLGQGCTHHGSPYVPSRSLEFTVKQLLMLSHPTPPLT
ncbi:hypothetical protein HanIR_Chr08g0385561 [Helianthus annuus]|nr:hypothetical protein HanIR_Chr08g0385561 [Helianthus annuus]